MELSCLNLSLSSFTGFVFDPKTSPGGGNGYSSLAGNFPSHISIFGNVNPEAAGMGSGGAGRALSAGADDGGAGLSLSNGAVAGGGPWAGALPPGSKPDSVQVNEEMEAVAPGINLPTHISIFGSNSGDDVGDLDEQARLRAMDEAAAAAAGEHPPVHIAKSICLDPFVPCPAQFKWLFIYPCCFICRRA